MTLDFFIGVVLAWSVIDGDTIRVDLKPWPNHAAIEERIRFLGIDTAEVHSKVPCEHELAAQASAYTRAALTAAKRIVVVVPVDAAGRDSFVRPVRSSYVHVGIAGPRFALQDITAEQKEWWKDDPDPFVKFEPYPPGHKGSSTGRYWGRRRTSMPSARAAARSPRWAGRSRRRTRAIRTSTARPTAAAATVHRPVGAAGEFVWDGTDERVGT